jgi:hypothetical protein
MSKCNKNCQNALKLVNLQTALKQNDLEIFQPMQDEEDQKCILNNNEYCDLYSVSSVETAVKHGRLRWDVHVDSMYITQRATV